MSAVVSSANQVLKSGNISTFSALASLTVELWLKFVTDPNDYGYALAWGGGTWQIYSSVSAGAGSMKPRGYWLNTTPTAYTKDYSGNLSISTWYHLAIVVPDSNTLRLFINGVEDGVGSATTGSGLSGSGFLWLGSNSADDNPRNIKLSDVRVWNTIRTGAQILANKNSRLVGNESGLIGYWKLNESAGNTATDLTASANDLTATAASWDTADDPTFADISGSEGVFSKNPASVQQLQFYKNIKVSPY